MIFYVMLKWGIHNIAQYYMGITILSNITSNIAVLLPSIQFTNTENYILYYSKLHVKS